MRFHLRENRPRRGLTIATLAAMLAGLLPMLLAAPAQADGITSCGSGYHKQNEGTAYDQDTETVAGHTVTTKAGGGVRFCTRERWNQDQRNQRVVIGLPSNMWASGWFTGTRLQKVCLRHTITVNAAHISSGSSISISIPLGAGWSQSFTDKSTTVSSVADCAPSAPQLNSIRKDLKFTVPNAGWSLNPSDPAITSVKVTSTATMTYANAAGVRTTFEAVASDTVGVDVGKTVESGSPVLDKPVVTLSNPTSRIANFALHATDKGGSIAKMRVKATGDADWRPWVPYPAQDPNTGLSTGTVVLPDRYGAFTVWFQVMDNEGNTSTERAAENVTRIQDVTGPALTGGVSKADPAGRVVSYSLNATDDYNAVTQMRVLVSGEDWRPWVPFSPTGTVVLPDGYGRFGLSFQVMDAAGNASAPLFAGAVTRTAPVSLTLRQIDNLGNLRSCGTSEAAPCTDVVKKFRTTIDSPIVPNTNLLLKAWRNVNGVWVETSTSPFMFEPIAGRRTVDMTITANLLAGLWRFQAQVPRDGDVTDFAASGYQFLRIG